MFKKLVSYHFSRAGRLWWAFTGLLIKNKQKCKINKWTKDDITKCKPTSLLKKMQSSTHFSLKTTTEQANELIFIHERT